MIIELKKQLNKNNIQRNKNMKIIEEEISKKEEELNKFLNNKKYSINKIDNNIIYIYINSVDQQIKDYEIPCFGSDTFAEIEVKLYKKYPQYIEKENYFLANGSPVKRFKTIFENNIKTGDRILLYVKALNNKEIEC